MAKAERSTNKYKNKKLRARRRRILAASLKKQENEVKNRSNCVQLDVSSESADGCESGNLKLRMWAIKHNITRNALCELLKILVYFGLTWLPLDARTLLETPKHVQLVNLSNGTVWYNSIEKCLREIFSKLDRNLVLKLNFNIDGIPLYDSSKKEFWPILANIDSMIYFTLF